MRQKKKGRQTVCALRNCGPNENHDIRSLNRSLGNVLPVRQQSLVTEQTDRRFIRSRDCLKLDAAGKNIAGLTCYAGAKVDASHNRLNIDAVFHVVNADLKDASQRLANRYDGITFDRRARRAQIDGKATTWFWSRQCKVSGF